MTSIESATTQQEQQDSQPNPPESTEEQNIETTPQIAIDDFMKVDLRVAEIVHAEALPKSKKLLKLGVTLGDSLGERQILAGIAQHYQPEQLVGKRIIVVSNLKPAKLMGHESQGMLLAAAPDDDSVISVVTPPAEIPLGARVR